MEKKTKARKDHICNVCEKTINYGSFYIRHKSRVPSFEDETQTGIEYLSFSVCLDCYSEIKKELAEIEAYQQTEEYKYIESMQEHRYP